MEKVSSSKCFAMKKLLSVVGGMNSRKLVCLTVSALIVTMLFVTVDRRNRVLMLASKPPSSSPFASSGTLRSAPPNENEDTNRCRNRTSSSSASNSRLCLRYEVFVIDTGVTPGNRSSGSSSSIVEHVVKRLLLPSECRLMSVYKIHIVYHRNSGAVSNETKKLLNESVQRCVSEGDDGFPSLRLNFIELTDGANAVATLNQAMTDSYVLDDIDFVSLIFLGSGESAAEERRFSLASAADLVRALGRSRPQNVGAVFQNVGVSGCVFFCRRHFEIFGFYLPQRLTDPNRILSLFQLLYAESQLTVIAAGGEVVEQKISKPSPTEFPSLKSDLPDYDKTLDRYVRASALNPCLRCVNRTGRMVVSMSLYGSDTRYTMGAIRNAQLLPVVFPGWRLWLYVEKPDAKGAVRYGRVPDRVLAKLVDLGAEIVWVDVAAVGLAPMLWRFTVMDAVDVDVFTVRDCDSRLTPRDAAVVSDWLKTDSLFHCIRDHPSHSSYSVSGGLWGARRQPLQQLVGNLRETMKRHGAGYVEDMNFLGQDLWPKVVKHAYCHDSFSCERFPSSHPFPVARIGSEHLGEVYDQHSNGRQGDINILMNAGVNKKCVPS